MRCAPAAPSSTRWIPEGGDGPPWGPRRRIDLRRLRSGSHAQTIAAGRGRIGAARLGYDGAMRGQTAGRSHMCGPYAAWRGRIGAAHRGSDGAVPRAGCWPTSHGQTPRGPARADRRQPIGTAWPGPGERDGEPAAARTHRPTIRTHHRPAGRRRVGSLDRSQAAVPRARPAGCRCPSALAGGLAFCRGRHANALAMPAGRARSPGRCPSAQAPAKLTLVPMRPAKPSRGMRRDARGPGKHLSRCSWIAPARASRPRSRRSGRPPSRIRSVRGPTRGRPTAPVGHRPHPWA